MRAVTDYPSIKLLFSTLVSLGFHQLVGVVVLIPEIARGVLICDKKVKLTKMPTYVVLMSDRA